MSMKLHEIERSYHALLKKLEQGGGELLPGMEAQLEELETNRNQKVTNIAKYVQNVRAAAEVSKIERKKMEVNEKRLTKIASRLESYLYRVTGPKLNIETSIGKVSWVKTSGKPSLKIFRGRECRSTRK